MAEPQATPAQAPNSSTPDPIPDEDEYTPEGTRNPFRAPPEIGLSPAIKLPEASSPLMGPEAWTAPSPKFTSGMEATQPEVSERELATTVQSTLAGISTDITRADTWARVAIASRLVRMHAEDVHVSLTSTSEIDAQFTPENIHAAIQKMNEDGLVLDPTMSPNRVRGIALSELAALVSTFATNGKDFPSGAVAELASQAVQSIKLHPANAEGKLPKDSITEMPNAIDRDRLRLLDVPKKLDRSSQAAAFAFIQDVAPADDMQSTKTWKALAIIGEAALQNVLSQPELLPKTLSKNELSAAAGPVAEAPGDWMDTAMNRFSQLAALHAQRPDIPMYSAEMLKKSFPDALQLSEDQKGANVDNYEARAKSVQTGVTEEELALAKNQLLRMTYGHGGDLSALMQVASFSQLMVERLQAGTKLSQPVSFADIGRIRATFQTQAPDAVREIAIHNFAVVNSALSDVPPAERKEIWSGADPTSWQQLFGPLSRSGGWEKSFLGISHAGLTGEVVHEVPEDLGTVDATWMTYAKQSIRNLNVLYFKRSPEAQLEVWRIAAAGMEAQLKQYAFGGVPRARVATNDELFSSALDQMSGETDLTKLQERTYRAIAWLTCRMRDGGMDANAANSAIVSAFAHTIIGRIADIDKATN